VRIFEVKRGTSSPHIPPRYGGWSVQFSPSTEDVPLFNALVGVNPYIWDGKFGLKQLETSLYCTVKSVHRNLEPFRRDTRVYHTDGQTDSICRVSLRYAATKLYFRPSFLGVILPWLVLRGAWTELYQIWWGHIDIIYAPKLCLDFRYVASF